MKTLLFQSLLIATILGCVSCKSSKTAATENNEMKQNELTAKHWKLIELKGVMISETSHEPFLIFESEENRVHGNTSCNKFFGTFEMKKKNEITFSQLGTTKMACIGNNVETPFIQALDSTSVYKIDNGLLSFFDAKGTILARFKGETPK